MKKKTRLLFLMSICFLQIFTHVIFAEEISIESLSIDDLVQNDNYPGLFEIRIVSPDMLNTVISNAGSKAVPLKIERGLYIGVITPGIIYIRGDLNEYDFPLLESKKVNLKEEVGKHLLDITFGRDNAKTDLFGNTQDYLIWIDKMFLQSDIQAIHEYIDLLNDLSQTTTFEDEEIGLPSYQPNYQPVPYLYYKISIIDKDFFKEKLDDRDSSTEQLLKDEKGNTVGLVRKDHLYLISDLTGEERKHFLLKGLLFSMGFHGESLLHDSFFFPGNTTRTHLSNLDKEAIQLLYGGRLESGLDIEGMKKSLDINKED